MPPKTKESETCQQQLEVKEKVLSRLRGQVSVALTEENTREISKLKNQLQERLDNGFSLILKTTDWKLSEGKDIAEVEEWSN